jgi:ABC-type antimicrobial peptide transport system permease subunit
VYVVLRWAAGVDHDEALAERGIDAGAGGFEANAVGPTAPPEVVGLDDVQRFPLLAGAALVVLGVIATSHALVVTVRRRRAELGVLSALGFGPSQRRTVILGQATTIAAVALALGLPLGAAAGRALWSAIARSIGLATDASFPLLLLGGGAVGLVVVLNLIAAVPASGARRLRIADALRAE